VVIQNLTLASGDVGECAARRSAINAVAPGDRSESAAARSRFT
jgi:hypothetical protein